MNTNAMLCSTLLVGLVALSGCALQASEPEPTSGAEAEAGGVSTQTVRHAAGGLAKALWSATRHARGAASKSVGLRPQEIFYTPPRSATTCTPTSYCESFLSGWACVALYADCSGDTWVWL